MLSAVAQATRITGVVTDAKTGEPVPFATVRYEGKAVGTTTAYDGKYSIVRMDGTLVFSSIGYGKITMKVKNDQRVVNVSLPVEERILKEATIKRKRKKYNRKENPAVEFMRKVIAAKKNNDLHKYDYFSYDKYQKLTFAINEFTEKVFQEGNFKNMPFLKDHVETCKETGKLILPVAFQENMSRHIYRKNPQAEKDIVTGERASGLNQLFTTGDIFNAVLEDAFTDVDIYEDNVRLLRFPFISPISTRNAIGFYRYFLGDTVMIGNDRCLEVTLTPNNPQDFGFMGSLYVMVDGTYRIRKVALEIPRRSDVNWVEHLNVDQEFVTLPTGEQVISSDKMIVQLKVTDNLTKFHVQRTTDYSEYAFNEIPVKEFKFPGNKLTLTDAKLRTKDFWAESRPVELTKAESDLGGFVQSLKKMKNFNILLFLSKAFVENYIETSTSEEKPNLLDIGPVNTFISQNFIDGLRLRAGGQTTANLNPHLFAKGYVAYGFKDHRVKGLGELTYAINKKLYMPGEFPMNNIVVSYQSDVASPTDKFMNSDKDNVFASFKFQTVDQMMYYNRFHLKYQREWRIGLRLETEFKRERDEPCGRLFYQKLDATGVPTNDPAQWQRFLNTSDFTVSLNFQPGVKYVNTKQRRFAVNHEPPVFEVKHTLGFRGLGGDYNYNFTEGHIYKRFWLPTLGRVDVHLKGGIEWDRVPFPLLIMPAGNQSYILNEGTFSMLSNMEFLNDRYTSLMVFWDLNGRLFNRIPFLRKLKWRECLGFNMLYGSLSDKNNPEKNPGDSRLMYFPGHFMNDGTYQYSSYTMGSQPYWEVYAGVHNIFKVLHVQVVRRLNYLDNPRAHKWGLRLKLNLTF